MATEQTMILKASYRPLVEIEIPHEFDLEDVAREYESYGYCVERDVRLHHLLFTAIPINA